MFVNLNGLAGKAEEVLRFNKDNDIDLTLMVETWLSPSASVPFRPQIINLTNYNNQVTIGGRRASGGILVTCKPHIHNQCRVLFEDPGNSFAVFRANTLVIIVVYLPPSADDGKLVEILAAAERYTNELTLQCIIVGDLNARMGNITGDTITNPRGARLRNELENSAITIQMPAEGKWTSWGGGGRGIPDILLANFPVRDLIVHERECLGGSDHRPITFLLPTDDVEPTVEFQRWNVRRLTVPKYAECYKQRIEIDQAKAQQALQRLRNDLTGHARDCAAKQQAVDKAWTVIKNWINSAAERTIGRLQVADRTPDSLWTRELEQTREDIRGMVTRAQEATNAGRQRQEIQQLAAELVQAQRIYRADLADRRRTLFEEAVDKLAVPQNYSALLRMVKGAKSRRDRTGCKLDPDKMEDHANHYRGTFGADPTGQADFDPQTPQVPTIQSRSTDEIFNGEAVRSAVGSLPRGKACGTDGIPAELIIAGGNVMANVLTVFLQLVHTAATIPSDWRLALIVPVYKKKGSDQDVANYRPIALTCTVRRLYERILIPELTPALHKLDDCQGGFRPMRAAVDQAMVLHEVLNSNTSASVILMDIKAAYDEVDRRALWKVMRQAFGVDDAMMMRLQDLFEHNSSALVINGQRSEPIANKRGLLQGSSASPLLFNCHIHSMSIRLRKPHVPTVRAHGIQLNNLLFADDTALLGGNLHDLAQLLRIAQEWATEIGIRFSPTKCIFLGPTPETRAVPLKLYDIDLPSEEVSLYLGLPFRSRGIDWSKLATERAKKARGIIMTLASLGMNAMGWSPAASANVYKSFVRPVLEYGVCLKQPSARNLKVYERVQTLALRTMTSSPRNTSAAALHKMLMVEPFKQRALELNLLWGGRIHNSTDRSVPAVRIWRGALLGNHQPHQESLPRLTRTNPLWNLPTATLLDHTMAPLIAPAVPTLPYSTPCKTPRPMSEEDRLTYRHTTIASLEEDEDSIAGVIQVEPGDKARLFLSAQTGVDRKTRLSLMRWMLGSVTRHETCVKCGATLTRRHAADCSGSTAILIERYPAVNPPNGRATMLDAVLNHTRNLKPAESNACADVAAAVALIYMECKGYQQQANGFWIDPNRPDHQPVPRPPRPPDDNAGAPAPQHR
jgi:hypothetical protein